MVDFNEVSSEQEESVVAGIDQTIAELGTFTGLGIPIVPVKAGTKRALESGWQSSATTDLAQLAAWAFQYPGCSWAAVPGQQIIVIDVDVKNGKDGPRSLACLAGYNSDDLNTFTVASPSGGLHYYYSVGDERFTNRVEFIPGVDLKTAGGLVLVPPSPGYEVVLDSAIRSLPNWIREPLTVPLGLRSNPKRAGAAVVHTKRSNIRPRSLVLDDPDRELAKIDPDLSRDDWRDLIWSFLSYYGTEENIVETLEAWSKDYSKGFNQDQFGRLIAGYDPTLLPDGYDPSKKIREVRGRCPRLEGFLPPEGAHGADIAKLASATTGSARAFLEKNGNTISAPHERALGVVAKTLASVGYADTRARIAIPLFTGGGKTVSVASYCAQVSQHRSDLGILIAFSTIDQIREMHELLAKHFGIPESAIGAKHSGEGGKLDHDLAKEKQFILCTHERIKRGDWDWLYRFGGTQRQIIWDEALISTKTSHINTDVLSDEIANFSIAFRRYQKEQGTPHPKAADTKRYLNEVWEKIISPKGETIVELPEKSFGFPSEVYSSEVLQLLDSPSAPTVFVDREKHAFWFEVTVPDEFERIVILDASARKRLLEKLDTTIDILPMPVEKDYSTLTIHYCKANVGRNTVMDRIKGGRLQQEVAHILQHQVPPGESCVLFHLAERANEDSAVKQLNQIHLAGPEGEGLPRRSVQVSWGKAKGVNSLKEHRFGTHLGIQYWEPSRLRANMAAQKRDEFYPVSERERKEVQLSEHVDLIYQGISRLACRDTQNGVAVPTDFWLFYPDENICAHLEDLFPGVRIVSYEPLYIESRPNVRSIAAAILAFLASLPSSKRTVAISEVRKELKIRIKSNKPIWSEGVMPAVREEIDAIGWISKDRSFVRNSEARDEALSSYYRSDVFID